jgi:hypothetical protein
MRARRASTPYTWEPKRNVPMELLDAFVEEQRPPPPAKRARAAPLAGPYTLGHVEESSTEEQRAQRRDDAAFIEEEVARAAAKSMRSAREKTKKPRQLCAMGVSEEMYVALWERQRAAAVKLVKEGGEEDGEEGGGGDDAVSAIAAKAGAAGGDRVVDEFQVLDGTLVDELLMPYAVGGQASGALYMPEETKACALVPPLSFKFEMKRSTRRRMVRVFGHVATIDVVGQRVVPACPVVDADQVDDWEHAHLEVLATALGRMPEGALAQPIAAWASSE